MSELQTELHAPAAATPRRTSVWAWFLLLLIALGVLGAAVAWAGGVGEVGKLLGSPNLSLSSFSIPGFGGGPSSGGGGATPPVSDRRSVTALPADAQSRMYSQQIKSRARLTDLVQGRISTMTFGTPITAENSATVPCTAAYKDGSKITGNLVFTKYKNVWYFTSLVSQQASDEVSPASFDSGVASTIAQQQAEPDTQEMIAKDLLTGAYRQVKIDGVHAGPRTATVDFTVTERSDSPTKGRFVLVSKTDAGSTFWFVARFEKR
jgi:hypothetical protein